MTTNKKSEVDIYFEEKKEIVKQNEIAFKNLRSLLVPPLEPGEFIVVCEKVVKARFKNSPYASVDCAKYLIHDLRKPCFVHREPMPEEQDENSIKEFLPLQIK